MTDISYKNKVIVFCIVLAATITVILFFSRKKSIASLKSVIRSRDVKAYKSSKFVNVNPDVKNDIFTSYDFYQTTGMILPFYAQYPPDGWLVCDGREYLISEYQDLYDYLGVSSNSTDNTHFKVPNIINLFIGGYNPSAISGENSGIFGKEVADTLGYHLHDLNDPGHTHGYSWTRVDDGGSDICCGSKNAPQSLTKISTSSSYLGNITVTPTKDSDDNETRPINMALIYCIKT
jgi:microcystin-dependent protein